MIEKEKIGFKINLTNYFLTTINNYLREWILNIQQIDISTNQNLSRRMRHIKFSGILKFKQIT